MDSRKAVTVITGGTRGIGAAIARRLAAMGHDLVLGYASRSEDATALEAEVGAFGGRCLLVGGDVASEHTVENLFSTAEQHFGRITGLVNNAGATIHVGNLADTPVDVIRRVIDVNLTGAILCARRAIQNMTNHGCGTIVNISSVAAATGSPSEYVHYAAAKAGIDALTTGLAQEVGHQGIRVVGVAPGTTRTGIHNEAGDPGRPERVAERVPLGRVAEPEDIAATVAWLFERDAGYISGTTIRVAGGL